MIASGADLHVGESRRFAGGRLDFDRYSLLSGCSVSELTVAVASPCVDVSVAAQDQ